jgi:hypothetical protein
MRVFRVGDDDGKVRVLDDHALLQRLGLGRSDSFHLRANLVAELVESAR